MKAKESRKGANLESTLKEEDNRNMCTLINGQKTFDA